MKPLLKFLIPLSFLIACTSSEIPEDKLAPGAPGDDSFWNFAAKTGVGTAYEMYADDGYSNDGPTGTISKVWFSLTQGIITETAYGMIHEAQLKKLRFVVAGEGILDVEDRDMNHAVEYLHTDEAGRPLSLAYRMINEDKDGKYRIEKHIFTSPDNQSLFCRVQFSSTEPGMKLYLLANPHMGNTGSADSAFIDQHGIHAVEGNNYLTIGSSESYDNYSVGFKGTSDLLTQLENGEPTSYLATGGRGNVTVSAGWNITEDSFTTDIVVGFGETLSDANSAATETLDDGYERTLNAYNGQGQFTGWEDYLGSLENIPDMRSASGDDGKLLNASAMVLKALEDKENAGALIASLSIPWGDSVSAENSATGYRAVWPRDFYQCAMALLALGDEKTALTAFEYLQKVQVGENTPGNKGAGGWFLQKTVVDGTLEWFSIQMDQTAMPIMLGWKLWKKGVLSTDSLEYWYGEMLKPAADFLVEGGDVDLDWNKTSLTPPFTQQERWEEQSGYSPSTMAAIISGLVCASDIAEATGNTEDARKYLDAADLYESQLEQLTVTTSGPYGDGEYYIRINKNENPNDKGKLVDNNARPGMEEDLILDAGFLELVRYGVREPDDEIIMKSIRVLDDTSLVDNLQVRYLFPYEGDTYEGWRRYGNDGYGEDTSDGSNYGRMVPGQRGRVWPFFTGERGHYMIRLLGSDGLSATEKRQLTDNYARALEYFANEGLMLPEQVWEGVGNNTAHQYELGEGTSSATPLAWTHAEYVKLLKSVSDGNVWDFYPLVNDRYQK